MATTVTGASITDGQPEVVAIYKNKITITDEQIKTLPSAFIPLIEAQGANKVLIFHSALLVTSYTSSYTNRTTEFPDSSLCISYGDDDVTASSTVSTYRIQETNRSTILLPKVTAEVNAGFTYIVPMGDDTSAIKNKPLKLITYNTLGDFTGGDAANILEVTVFYSIIDL